MLTAEKVGIRHRGKGHLANSCHPMLPQRNDKPNAKYETVHSTDTSKFVVLVTTLRIVRGGEELLTDYHWFLNGISHALLPQGVVLCCKCKHCKEN